MLSANYLKGRLDSQDGLSFYVEIDYVVVIICYVRFDVDCFELELYDANLLY